MDGDLGVLSARGETVGSNESPSQGDDLIKQFAALWEAEGAPPNFVAFLEAHPGASMRARLGIALVDQRRRWQAGKGWSVDDYLAAVPDLATSTECVALLRQGERLAREDNAPSSQTEHLPHASSGAVGIPTSWLTDEASTKLSGWGPPSLGFTFDEPRSTSAPTSSGLRTKDAHLLTTDADIDEFSINDSLEEQARKDRTEAILKTSRFTILRPLGTGGMGVVYLAHDRRRDELLALKTMRRVDPLALYRFKHEFRTLADLSHPNLVSLYELIADGDVWYFTMELVEGIDFIAHVRTPTGPDEVETRDDLSLDDEPKSPRGLTPGQICRLRKALRQLAAGVCALHDAGKLHRDIKPRNVLVTSGGRVVLLDFGLVADLSRSGRHQSTDDQIVGTVAYMAPEQGANQPVSPASDWYSVGVILYEALTGQLPFQGKPRQVLMNKSRSEPTPPSVLVRGVPEDLDSLCVALLRRLPEDRPTGLEVLARLDGEPPPGRGNGHGGIISAVPLIGRERHREALHAAFEVVRAGQPFSMLVSGKSGTGKTVLLQSFLNEMTGHDEAVVLAGRCYERESVPYKALDSIVDALSRYLSQLPHAEALALLPRDVALLARVFPVLRRVEAVAADRPTFEPPDQQELRRRAFAALRGLLERIGDRKTLVVAIDDLQWGDAENAALLADLFRPPEPPALLFLGCYRTEDAKTSPLLRALLGPGKEDGAGSVEGTGAGTELFHVDQELAIGSLSHGESRELALALLGRDNAVTRAEAHLIARESRGNPFFIAELVKHIQTVGKLVERLPAAGELQLDEVLWARVERLPAEARRLLEVVAVSGQPIGQPEAFHAAELGPDSRAAMALLRSGRLIRVTGPAQRDAIEVYHDRIRETIVAHLPVMTLKAHHGRLARTLEASGQADPEHLAVHFQEAGLPDRAAHYYTLAADRASEALAFAHAGRLYRRALDLRGPEAETGPETRSLLTRLGDALANAGRGGDAAQAYLAATAGANVAETLELNRRAAMQLLISGRVDEGLAVLQTVLSALGMALPQGPRRSLVSLLAQRATLRIRGLGFAPRDTSQLAAADLTRIDLCWSAATGLSIIDPILGAEFQARGLLLALRAGEPYRIARSLTLEAIHVSTAGTPSRGRVAYLLDLAEALADKVHHPHAQGMTFLARAIAALMLGRWPDARLWFDRAEEIFRARCTGVAWELDTVQSLALSAITQSGDLNELRSRWPVLLKEAQGRGDLYASTTLNTDHMTILRLADDDPETARRDLEHAMGRWSHRGFHVQHSTAMRARTFIDLYQNQGAAAWERLQAHRQAYERSMLLRIQMLRVEFFELHARAALAAAAYASNPRPLIRAAERDAGRLEREHEPWALAHAHLIRAGIAAARGDRTAAIPLLTDAIERFEAARMRLTAAAARRRLGLLLGGVQGRELILAADTWMASQHIRVPARMAATYAPGFRELPSSDSDPDVESDTRSKFP
jgi:tRNA A-37 threonylcarbamoyl transferase component Bud32